jgi:ABC-type transporter Mla MlaB component
MTVRQSQKTQILRVDELSVLMHAHNIVKKRQREVELQALNEQV